MHQPHLGFTLAPDSDPMTYVELHTKLTLYLWFTLGLHKSHSPADLNAAFVHERRENKLENYSLNGEAGKPDSIRSKTP